MKKFAIRLLLFRMCPARFQRSTCDEFGIEYVPKVEVRGFLAMYDAPLCYESRFFHCAEKNIHIGGWVNIFMLLILNVVHISARPNSKSFSVLTLPRFLITWRLSQRKWKVREWERNIQSLYCFHRDLLR